MEEMSMVLLLFMVSASYPIVGLMQVLFSDCRIFL